VKLEGRNADYRWQLAQVYGEQAQRAGVLRQMGLARRFKQEAEQPSPTIRGIIEARLNPSLEDAKKDLKRLTSD